MPEIVLSHVTKRWDKFYAVDDLNLVIEDNAFVTLLGPSGCGKTTTLRMIAGLETPTSGRITIGDRVVFDSEKGINIPANKRKVGFLFQNYALWPNMTVYKNIAFGLTNIKDELPRIDFEAKKAAQLIEVLKRPDETVRIIKECIDKKGKLDTNKAHIKLIDRFEISMFSAKTVMGWKLHESLEPCTVAAARLAECEKTLESARAKCAAEGCVFNDDFAYVKDGKVLTSVRKLTAEEIDLTVRRVARIVKIGMFMDRYPSELSGGQQQRVAIARTLAPEPTVLFMDEPLSNLDAKLRLEMRSELQRLHIDTGSTFIYVTHDQTEAMTMGSRIVVMKDGFMQQQDTPQNLYDYPANLFVACFIGTPQMNIFRVRLEKRGDAVYASFGNNSIKVPAGKVQRMTGDYIGKEVYMGIRPENIHDESAFISAYPDACIDVSVELIELMGSETYLYLSTTGKDENFIARVDPRTTSRGGDHIKVGFDVNRLHFFDVETEKTILSRD